MTKHVQIREPDGNELWHDEFDDAKIASHWTEINNCGAGHGDFKEGYGWLSFSHNATNGGTANTGHFLVADLSAYTAAGPPLTIEYYVRMLSDYDTSYCMQLTAWSNSNTSGSGTQALQMGHNAASYGADVVSNRVWTGWNTGVSYTNFAFYVFQQAGYYVQHVWESANTYRIRVSTDGISWLSSGTEATTLTPSYYGLGCTNYNTGTKLTCSYRYIRLYSGVGGTTLHGRPSDTL